MAKEISDKEIMAQLLEALNMRALPFSMALENVHRNTIYKILNSEHGITHNLATKIRDKYPNVSMDFLERGIMPILIDDKLKPNIQPEVQLISDVFSTPKRLSDIEATQARIEGKLDQILNLLTNHK